MEPMDEYVREAVAAFLSDPVNLKALADAYVPRPDPSSSGEAAELVALTDRKNALTRLFAQGGVVGGAADRGYG
ncbi:hypothetical protein GY12_21090 [Micrococcus luteus]|nr:hypothetical protein GY12_21090 [Micrococcus luteus]